MPVKDRLRVAVLGAGGHGKVLSDAVLAEGTKDLVGFFDEDEEKVGSKILGYPVWGWNSDRDSLMAKHRIDALAIGIGNNYLRARKFSELRDSGYQICRVIHPAATVSRSAELGEGVVVFAGAVINAGSVLQENVCVNTSASVDHDNWLGSHSQIMPGAVLAGNVRVESYAYVGSGAIILPNQTIKRYSYVGAGAVVLADVPEGVKVAGVPARQIALQSERPDLGTAEVD